MPSVQCCKVFISPRKAKAGGTPFVWLLPMAALTSSDSRVTSAEDRSLSLSTVCSSFSRFCISLSSREFSLCRFLEVLSCCRSLSACAAASARSCALKCHHFCTADSPVARLAAAAFPCNLSLRFLQRTQLSISDAMRATSGKQGLLPSHDSCITSLFGP